MYQLCENRRSVWNSESNLSLKVKYLNSVVNEIIGNFSNRITAVDRLKISHLPVVYPVVYCFQNIFKHLNNFTLISVQITGEYYEMFIEKLAKLLWKFRYIENKFKFIKI